MTLIYIYVNDNEKARESMVKFMKSQLKNNPEYDPRNSRSTPESKVPEFLELYYELQALPIYYLGLRVGANFAQVETTTNFSIDQSNIARGSYQSQLGYEVALALEFPFGGQKRSFSLVTELVYRQQGYQFSDQILDFANITFTETQNQLSLPILLKYYFKRKGYKVDKESPENPAESKVNKELIKNKIQPFLVLGGAVNYVMSAQTDLSRIDVLGDIAGGGSRDPITGTYDLLAFEQREKLQYSLVAGGGFRFRNFLKSGSDVILEGRFNWGLTQQVIGENRGVNDDLIYKFGYIDSDFKLHNFSINISYMIPKYNPKAKKGKKSNQPYQFQFD